MGLTIQRLGGSSVVMVEVGEMVEAMVDEQTRGTVRLGIVT